MEEHMNIFGFYSQRDSEVENNLTRALAICLKYDPVFTLRFLSEMMDELSINSDTLPPDIRLQKGASLGEIGDDINRIYAVGITAGKLNDRKDKNHFDTIDPRETDKPILDLVLRVNDDLIICEVKRNETDCTAQLKNQVMQVIKEISNNEEGEDNGISDEKIIYKHLLWGEIIDMLDSVHNLKEYGRHNIAKNFHEFLLCRYPSWSLAKKMHQIKLGTIASESVLNNRLKVITSMVNQKIQKEIGYQESTENIKIGDKEWADRFEIQSRGTSTLDNCKIMLICWPAHIKGQGHVLFEGNKNNWEWLSFNDTKFECNGITGEIGIETHIRFFTRGKEIEIYNINPALARDFFCKDNFDAMTGKHKNENWETLREKLAKGLDKDWKKWESNHWQNIADSGYGYVYMSMSASFYVQFPFEELSKMEKEKTDDEITQFYIDAMDTVKNIIDENKPYTG